MINPTSTDDDARGDVPDDPYKAFAWMVSRCASGLCAELTKAGKTETQARNAVVHLLLRFAAGEACRIAREEGREPDPQKWLSATSGHFQRAAGFDGTAEWQEVRTEATSKEP